MSRVLVTGGTGFLATHLIVALLRAGRPVRTTLRSPTSESDLRAAVRRGGADDTPLECVIADLTSDDGWPAAVAGCEEVHHVASPIPTREPDDPDELIVPAREGTLRVLRAAIDAGARRTVLTSSFAAVRYTAEPTTEFTEEHWTDPDTPGLSAYARSKAIAERAAWELTDRHGTTELTVLNPTFVFGPPLSPDVRSSLRLLKAMLDGTTTLLPRQRFGVVDVRDVADLHLRAMAAPNAAGRRYLAVADGPTLTHVDLAEILRRLGPLASRVPTRQEPGEDPPPLVIRNTRARTDLAWNPRPAETTIIQTIEGMRALEMLPPDPQS
ncbi:NAD-dependent epimerase/dehydratase family protein [Actinomadura gamaensis]|uniref:NAD-dependent epimerase/dehydratase family protein n=1 Tax=Actinomadura gamaensis TaxID=1763541 RepID=A0ABV9TZM0_9ACTN